MNINDKFDIAVKNFEINYYKLTEQEKFICKKFYKYGVDDKHEFIEFYNEFFKQKNEDNI